MGNGDASLRVRSVFDGVFVCCRDLGLSIATKASWLMFS